MKPAAKKIVVIICVLLVSCCCLAPVPVACGAPGRTCRTGPGPLQTSHIYYDLEPLSILAIEAVLQVDLPIYYFKWESSN